MSVPILIFSAGLGDVIDEALKRKNLMRNNVKVIANYMNYDDDGKLTEFAGELIHGLNKSETAISQAASYFQKLHHRPNVILLGDSLGDLQMFNRLEFHGVLLTIGFLNDKVFFIH